MYRYRVSISRDNESLSDEDINKIRVVLDEEIDAIVVEVDDIDDVYAPDEYDIVRVDRRSDEEDESLRQ